MRSVKNANGTSYQIDEKAIRAIECALMRGEKVEISPDRDGSFKIRTIYRKELKIS